MAITRAHAAVAMATIAATGGLAACGGGNDKTTPAAPAPESVIVPDAKVTAGLKQLVVIADRVATGSGKAAVKQLEPVWMRIEGTVKRNEPDMYISVEDSLALLNKSGAAEPRDGARLMARTVAAYLAKHPG